MSRVIACLAFTVMLFTSQPTMAEPHWIPVVVATGPLRDQIRNTDVLLRPYRPLHFYGNAMRRAHYRGRILPNRYDYRKTVAGILSR